MAHPVLFLIVGAIAYKLYLGAKVIGKYSEAEIKKTIIDEFKAYNLPDDLAEKFADSASGKIMAGKITLKNISNALNEVLSEMKEDLTKFLADLSVKTKAIRDELATTFTDYFRWTDGPGDEAEPTVTPASSKKKTKDSSAQTAIKKDRRDVIVGKDVRVKCCGAKKHNDNARCVCSFVKKIVTIKKRSNLVAMSGEPLYQIKDTQKLVTRGEVILPKK